MNKNLNFKISILIGILTFVVALVVGFYSNNISKKQLEINSGESLVKLSKRVNDILDREMLERYREIRFAASLPIMTSEKTTIEEKREFIQKIKNNYNHHEWIGYALPDGTVEVGTNGYLEGKNVKSRPWHPNGLVAPYIGDVHDALLLAKLLPNSSGEPIYFSDVAFPVINNESKTLGVLCTHLTWQWTRDVIRSIQKENDVDIFLLSKDGGSQTSLYPEKRSYFSSTMPMTEAAIDAGLTRDIYVSLGEELGDQSWAVRVYYKPFVDWIWGGCLLMALGGVLAMSDKRYRMKLKNKLA